MIGFALRPGIFLQPKQLLHIRDTQILYVLYFFSVVLGLFHGHQRGFAKNLGLAIDIEFFGHRELFRFLFEFELFCVNLNYFDIFEENIE